MRRVAPPAVALPVADGVVLLERDAPGVDLAMAAHARGTVAMDGQRLGIVRFFDHPGCSRFSSGTFGGGGGGGSSSRFLSSHMPRLIGWPSLPSESPGQNAGVSQDAAAVVGAVEFHLAKLGPVTPAMP